MMQCEYPILEFDRETVAVINPKKTLVQDYTETVPKTCVLAFMYESVQALVDAGEASVFHALHTVCGDIPLYRLQRGGEDLLLVVCPIGAPIAAGIMEEIHAMGVNRFISFGGAGVLSKDIPVGHILLPERALRDEGLSYHYLPAARFVEGDPLVLASMEETLRHQDAKFIRTTTWTTDAFYRETPDIVALRKSEGCVCVEMEVAAFMAVAKFRGIRYGAMLYAADNLDTEIWDDRNWSKIDTRSWLLEMAMACAVDLCKE